jgi:hypothetical protein
MRGAGEVLRARAIAASQVLCWSLFPCGHASTRNEAKGCDAPQHEGLRCSVGVDRLAAFVAIGWRTPLTAAAPLLVQGIHIRFGGFFTGMMSRVSTIVRCSTTSVYVPGRSLSAAYVGNDA